MSRSRENCRVIWVRPEVDTELIESMPATRENSFSRTVAIEEAMVSGLAPGSVAVILMVG
ncbi:MAG: hypothetical protein ACD_75C01879G0001 [uncultured bacterium]|nr:MAG: hypothetical protein ACD_75C01879G0001 [uncultured bacterium]